MGKAAEKAIPTIAKGLTEYKTVGNKVAGETLSWMGAVALPHLTALLDNEQPFVRSEVLYGLQSYTEDLGAIMPKVIELLQDNNRYVRRNAVKLVIKQGPAAAAAVPSLISLLDDHINVAYAATALSSIGEAALPDVQKILKSGKHTRYALDILAGMGEAAKPAIDDIAALTTGEFAAKATMALAAIGPAAASQIDRVLPLLGSEDSAHINAAAAALKAWHPCQRAALIQHQHSLLQRKMLMACSALRSSLPWVFTQVMRRQNCLSAA